MSNFTPEQLAGLEALEVLKRIYTHVASECDGYQGAVSLLHNRLHDLHLTQIDLSDRVSSVLGCDCWLRGLECKCQGLTPERQTGPTAHARKPLSIDEIDLFIEYAFGQEGETKARTLNAGDIDGVFGLYN